MTDATAVRRIALALPGAIEADHHGFPSFRIRGRIFATLPDEQHLHVMLDPESIREAVAVDPHACQEKWWGAKLAALRISLPDVDETVVGGLVEEAFRRKVQR
jgi:hypothetical protein